MTAAPLLSGEHAEDVLARLCLWLEAGQSCALVFVTATEGGAVRAPGALLAVSPDSSIGYISGGCIDADVILQARAACADQRPRELRYGAGSPFVDLPLPCGGAIEVFIAPLLDAETLRAAHQQLVRRQEIELIAQRDGRVELASATGSLAHDDFVFSYCPKLRLRIAGRGADALALARISHAAGLATHVQLVDEDDLADAQQAGLQSVEQLTTPAALAAHLDDPWTAFVLLFHDQEWEIPLLRQALQGPAFYVGAVGSKRTHAIRRRALRAAGCTAQEIDFVRGPIGLVPSLRDASMLAISALAEIVDAFPGKSSSRRARSAVLMLAAGGSRRFEDGDKLLADLNGRPVLDHSASNVPDDPALNKVAVIASGADDRREILERRGWRVIENGHARQGQATSLKAGMEVIKSQSAIDQVIVLLADMPFVDASHIEGLRVRADVPSTTCVMSESLGVLLPPALFKRCHFEALSNLKGDRGAKSVFQAIEHGNVTVPLPVEQAADIDSAADLRRAREDVNA
jgi:xanthine dehydrogenase accessory factor